MRVEPCDCWEMSEPERRVVSASREVRASSDRIFELIAEPSRQPEWDGNDNLAAAEPGQRVHAVGDIFRTTLTRGTVRDNHVVEFIEGRLIAWKPAEPGQSPVGHLWRWQIEPLDDERSSAVQTYDWTELDDPGRLERARATTGDRLALSVDRLAVLAERSRDPTVHRESQ